MQKLLTQESFESELISIYGIDLKLNKEADGSTLYSLAGVVVGVWNKKLNLVMAVTELPDSVEVINEYSAQSIVA